jgi:LysM repeat protein
VAFLLAVTVAVVLIRNGLEHKAPAHVTQPTTLMTSEAAPTTTSSTVKHAAKKRYWTVKAGDTFAVISAKTGVPVTTIEQLNPNASSTALFIGQKLRIQ